MVKGLMWASQTSMTMGEGMIMVALSPGTVMMAPAAPRLQGKQVGNPIASAAKVLRRRTGYICMSSDGLLPPHSQCCLSKCSFVMRRAMIPTMSTTEIAIANACRG